MKFQNRFVIPFACAVLCLLVLPVLLTAQPKYRTFNQVDLASKKAKAGKATGSIACFTFHNTTGDTATSLHARFNAHILSLSPTPSLPNQSIVDRGKSFSLDGGVILPGDSIVVCGEFTKKDLSLSATQWSWDKHGAQLGVRNGELLSSSFAVSFTQPNGGNVRDYIYKRAITRPAGLVLGVVKTDSALFYGWIRYKTADRKYYPHSGTPRCLDLIVNGQGGTKPFHGELKNPHVNKHDNHLLGELHALKLAILANDSLITEPDTPATRLGDLIYNDPSNLSDPFNGSTLRAGAGHLDTALTFCSRFTPAEYAAFDAWVTKVNHAFDGPYVAVTFTPFKLAGVDTLPAFLHPNPSAVPGGSILARGGLGYSIIDDVPAEFRLGQNYPNPFNPTTTITFTLPQVSRVTLTVYNLLGQEVARLLDREEMEDGEQSVDFDASALTSGVYFYRLSAEGLDQEGSSSSSAGKSHQEAFKRMLLIK